MRIGIVALQGGYSLHAQVLDRLEVEWQWVRNADDLASIDGLIIPGGESSVMLKLASYRDLLVAVKESASRMPIFGTCAGAILLAKQVSAPKQPSLELIDISIERNAYGRQLASRKQSGYCYLTEAAMDMVFIRAPKITDIFKPDAIKIIASCQDDIVCVQQGHHLAATFHPELAHDDTIHRYFTDIVAGTLSQ